MLSADAVVSVLACTSDKPGPVCRCACLQDSHTTHVWLQEQDDECMTLATSLRQCFRACLQQFMGIARLCMTHAMQAQKPRCGHPGMGLGVNVTGLGSDRITCKHVIGLHELQAVHASVLRDVDAMQGPRREHHHVASPHGKPVIPAETLALACSRHIAQLRPAGCL